MPRTLYRKLVDSHTVAVLDEQNVLLFCDLHLMNEYTSPQAFAGLHAAGRDVAMPGQNVAVVSHIIPTHPVKLRVIAEGVETEQQRSFLRENGCDEMQGYLFSRPLPPPQLAALLKPAGVRSGKATNLTLVN